MNKESCYCVDCKFCIHKSKETSVGTWSHTCIKFNIGRELLSESCDHFEIGL